jgi:3-deoxy-manno-octulosonate cytidylyltransferase (CMP-KDO synthetase)
MTDFNVIILAIFDESSFPNKVNAEIHSKLMIQYVYDSAKEAGAGEIVVATDSPRVGMKAEDFGAKVCMIVDEDLAGISRLAEVAERMGWSDETIVVNIPGDAPLTPPSIIKQVVDNLTTRDEIEFTTLYSNISPELAEKEYTIKMVVDNDGYVMYFSRSAIPYRAKNSPPVSEYKSYIELNAYRVSLFKKYKELSNSELDRTENIDELKLMVNGIKIHAAEANSLIGQRVFTEKDIGRVQLQIAPNR